MLEPATGDRIFRCFKLVLAVIAVTCATNCETAAVPEPAIAHHTSRYDETIHVGGRKIQVVGRRGVALAQIQRAADEQPDWLEIVINRLYHDEGYAGVKAKLVAGALVIEEGPRYRLKAIRVFEREPGGGEIEPLPGTLPRHTRTGAWFSRRNVLADVEAIHRRYRDAGYANVEAIPDTKLDPARAVLDITIPIARGPLVTIDAIAVIGNIRTTEQQIRARIAVAVGQLYNESALERTKTALEAIGTLKSVVISTKMVPGHDDRLQLFIEVTEP